MLVAGLLYLPMLRADFVWDARAQVLTGDYIQQSKHWIDVLTLRVLTHDVLDFNRPVHLASMMIDAAVWGRNPLGFHLTNLLMHVAAVGLVIGVGRRLGASEAAAFLAGLFFAVHPLLCETVAEPSYREDLLVMLFTLAAIWFVARQPFRRIDGVAAALCCFLAVGAKESGAATPLLVAMAAWFVHGRKSWKTWAPAVIGCFVVSGTFLVLRFVLEPKTSVIFTNPPSRLGGTVLDSVLIQTRITAFYLRQLIWPTELCADYGVMSLKHYPLGFALTALILVIVLQAWLATKSRLCMLGSTLYWLALLPVSNLVPIYRPMADRFLYLPMAGMALVLAGVATWLRWGKAAILSSLCIAALLGGVCVKRQAVWQNSVALWTDTRARNPLSFDAPNNLAAAFVDAGHPAKALEPAAYAIKLSNAKSADPLSIQAMALDALGRTAEAEESMRQAIALDARYGNPDQLVEALTCEKPHAERLKIIIKRL